MRGELETYRKKRRFGETPEPKGAKGRRTKGAPLRYLIQRHAATRLHYDFRIEFDGVLKSWAVTKAPSRDPAVKRLAVEVEDHPLDYGGFEGTIPSGNYGAGTVQMWDAGTWTPQAPETLEADFARGSVKMWLDGERLKGGWALVRLKSDRGRPSKRNNWLLIKEKDEQAVPGEGDANMEIDASVTTGRSLAEIAEGRKQWTASKPVARKGPAKPKARAAVTAKANKPHAFTPLQMCKPVDYPPGGSGWVHEIKLSPCASRMSFAASAVSASSVWNPASRRIWIASRRMTASSSTTKAWGAFGVGMSGGLPRSATSTKSISDGPKVPGRRRQGEHCLNALSEVSNRPSGKLSGPLHT
jgi:bifunctional non-homologous end joining protein LigD